MELLDKAKDSVAREVGQRDGARQPRALAHGRDSKGAGHRQAIVAIPTGMERGGPRGAQVQRSVGWSMKPV
jgi:hypothetical protein